MKFKVLATPTSFSKGCSEPVDILHDGGCEITLSPYKRPMTEEQMAGIIGGFDAIILGLDPITEVVLNHAPRLKVISKHGVGVDNIDLGAASSKGIVVTNTPDVNADSVADLALCLMLNASREIQRNVLVSKGGDSSKVVGREMREKILGIIGLGRIGKEVVQRAIGFGMAVIYVDPNIDPSSLKSIAAKPVDRRSLFKISDFVSLHLPLTPETKNYVGKEELRLMKKEAYLVNTSRSGVVDESALRKVLDEGGIAGAALDVYEDNSTLRDHPRVLCLPHIGAYTYEAIRRMGVLCAEDIVRVLHGGQAIYRIV